MSAPLRNARHESFALHISNGHKLERAHELAGFKPDRKTAWSLRHRPDVARRVEEILKHRMQADTQRRARREKKEENLRDRAIRELMRIGFADVRDVVNWKREPVLSPDGEVLEIIDHISVTASDKLSNAAAAAIKGVFTKSGQVRVEFHDKRAALESLIKLLNTESAPTPPSVTVNQVNIGQMNSLDLARRVAFLLSAASAAPKAANLPVIEGQAVRTSIDTGEKPAD